MKPADLHRTERAGPASEQTDGKLSAYVKVVNPVWNGAGWLKRKVADFYVTEGRAVYVNPGQLKLVESHKKNLAAKARAAVGYDSIEREMPEALQGTGDGTRPMRADQTCKRYRNGQLMGDPKSHREFRT